MSNLEKLARCERMLSSATRLNGEALAEMEYYDELLRDAFVPKGSFSPNRDLMQRLRAAVGQPAPDGAKEQK